MATIISLVTRPKDIKPKGIRHQQSPSARASIGLYGAKLKAFHAVSHLCTLKQKSNASEPMKRNSAQWKRRSSI